MHHRAVESASLNLQLVFASVRILGARYLNSVARYLNLVYIYIDTID